MCVTANDPTEAESAATNTVQHVAKIAALDEKKANIVAEMKGGEGIFGDKSRGGSAVRLLAPDMSIDRGAMMKIAYVVFSNDSNDLRSAQAGHLGSIIASLATWGLTIDDIQVASMHGTSTNANDLNEADVINRQMTHLGRARGNPMLAVCQKSLTGHPKGAAGAWQLNGCMQMLQTGIVPGN
ncbi:hypothetical protein V500_11528 [Pseudogymnoascus sp. VKM F-4518 (FW-2643)]|nr:hypothetical protein V500_11528 [Pseudogymnoascus sp. VKM F-4518 (FW-2643)]